jgi:IS4 transposase
VLVQGHRRPVPQRWRAKVLACTDEAATARQVVEWYEIRWQIELFFRWFKCVLGRRHLISESRDGVTVQVDVALIAHLLLT